MPQKKKMSRRWLFLAGSLLFVIAAALFVGELPLAATTQDSDQNRTKLLTYVLRQQMAYHYSGKHLDDDLSRAAFQLYLKQLDYQKRFLLDGEVRQLRSYELQIDDEIQSGKIQLVPLAERLMSQGVARAENLTTELLSQPFDFSIDEDFETDPEKQAFCRSIAELRERWRKDLKYRVLTRYLTLAEEQGYTSQSLIPKEARAKLEQQAREKVLKQHKDYFNRLHQETLRDQYDRYLNAFARAYDPHTNYLPPQSKEDFDISMRGSLEGIGATLRDDEGYIKVLRVIPGSAADRQGQLQADDVILAVAQGDGEPVDVSDMRLRDAVALIRGKKGSEVRLTVRRAGHKPFVIPIVRDVVIIEDSFVKSAVVTDPVTGQLMGYIKIPSFYRDFEETREGKGGRNSTDDVREALISLKRQGVNGLILDLRNNGGGALTDAVGVAGLFIGNGPIVQVRSSGGSTKVLQDSDPAVEYAGPLVVLVNQFSASASEIVAAALQDYHRAIVVGSAHTHGKGTVQVIMNLDDVLSLPNMDRYMPLGAMKLTTQKFYRITGDSTQYRGVVPDIILPDRQEHSKFGERYLDYSLAWDSIGKINFTPWTQSLDVFPLLDHSRHRVDVDPAFAEIRRIAALLGERVDNTRQSLQVDTVWRERNETDNGKNLHGDLADDDNAKGDSRKGETDQDRLKRQVREDPYTLEAMAILNEMVPSRVPAQNLVGK